MPKVWLRCTVSPERRATGERIVTIVNAAEIPVAFYASAEDVTEDGDGTGHVRATYCGRREQFVLVAVKHDDDLASTNFILTTEDTVAFDDRWNQRAALLMPTRVTTQTRQEALANYRAARDRYIEMRARLESVGCDPQPLDEMFMALEQSVDPFVRWEVIAEDELEHRDA